MSEVLFLTTDKAINEEHLARIKEIFKLQDNGEYSYFRTLESVEQQSYFGNENVEFGYWGNFENVAGYTYYFDSMFVILQQSLKRFEQSEHYIEFANILTTVQNTVRYLMDSGYKVSLFINSVEQSKFEMQVAKHLKFSQMDADCQLDYNTIYRIVD